MSYQIVNFRAHVYRRTNLGLFWGQHCSNILQWNLEPMHIDCSHHFVYYWLKSSLPRLLYSKIGIPNQKDTHCR